MSPGDQRKSFVDRPKPLTQQQFEGLSLQPQDNWTGTTNQAERKRRQNRLNQRARRLRHQTKELDPRSPNPIAASSSNTSAAESSVDNNQSLVSFRGYFLLPTPERRQEAQIIAQKLYNSYRSGIPALDSLNHLTRLNVLDAFACNAISLGFTIEGLCRDELISPFNQHGPSLLPWQGPETLSLDSCPVTLRPTQIQKDIIHHPWIDLLPIPQLRDNLLVAMNAGLLDDDEICEDLLSIRDSDDGPQLLVWGGSWDIRGWEANIAFLKKWGWLMKGCPELCHATNEWRERRGEKKLRF